MDLIRWSREKHRDPSFAPLTADEVSKHNRSDDCWIIMDGVVYDVTDFLRLHPGGVDTIMEYAGKDCTDAFNQAHGYINKNELLFNSIVGVVVER
ncbi:similarity to HYPOTHETICAL PROTEIN OF THE CYTOCHROME B5 FAMILY: YDAA_SCHPO [Encephalitozoon cuniculi GB-M1]|uniref:Cytochrome b5 heme-binding domain-containing protein n=2 Tax=Encephalitozoon cuniculi TaxID=6035 RepID=Q8SWJ3_ENCCU|nr:cytochrome B5 [Encephalitozoon cuniculi GB-M1]AGE96122.1 hypothetical protein ECU01_1115 [Encephalitozoon cuniculi]KMV66767.1 cytochrome B5 [Encephalitozoon cuniculi EcunIII-L]UYI28485.1 cytochrome b5 reductase 4 [Encephalitozoon cuniculi]CAD24984.1 similarity to HYPOTHETICAL PROTEIN OF THE CYTOCHROME B5 FAMILY: YDAA_SCHPO [Encephalitozoon cuniculi GB-M1]